MSMTNNARRMLHSDAFTWYMEKDPTLRSTVVAVGRLDRPPDRAYLTQRVERLTLQVPAMRQRVQEPLWRIGPPWWVPDPAFDLDYHLRWVRLPEPADWSAVLQTARLAAMADFDRARPLWELTVLEGLPNGEAAIIMKTHHAVADGIGMIEISSFVIDPTRDMPPMDSLPAAEPPNGMSTIGLLLRSLRDNVVEGYGVGVRAGRGLLPVGLRTTRRPLQQTLAGVETVASIGRIVRPIMRSASPLMKQRQMVRYVDTITVPLAPLHDAAAANDGHLNDAFVTAMTGGLRRYHERHGTKVHELRMTMPVNIRHADDPIGGNRITLLRFALPVGELDPATRLRRISQTIRAWRAEPAIALTQGIAFALNLAPRPVIQGILRRVDFLASDVPGLTAPVYVAGAKLLAYFPFGPTIGTAVNATLLSYVDTCCIGVNIDVAAVPDPENLMTDLRAGFDEVLRLAPASPRRTATLVGGGC
jgi:diacylglycerol O-acyltransferase